MTPFARACRAIVDLQRGDPVNDFVWDTIWNERHKALDEWPVAQAVMVVLKAVREPTYFMIDVGTSQISSSITDDDVANAWREMVCEILKDGQE
jgi:hypothetical protein